MDRGKASARLAVLILAILFLGQCAIAQEVRKDEWLARPVDERTFRTYLEFFTYDSDLPFDAQTLDVKESEGVRREHFSFQSTPGERVFANLYSVTGANLRELPSLILLHGGAAGGKDSPRYTALSASLVRAGFVVLAIDMKHFGERATGLLKTFTEEEKHERLYNQPSLYLSWVVQVVKDVGRSIDYLVSQKGANPRRIGFFGSSRGAEVGFIVAAVEKRLSPVLGFYGGHFDGLEKAHLAAACPANYIGRISPRPLLMVNGDRDTDYDRETQVQPLFNLARPPKQILWLKGGHVFYTDSDLSAMIDWLQTNSK
jgi:dienelactone hydrolase